jgi:hypothetical protein
LGQWIWSGFGIRIPDPDPGRPKRSKNENIPTRSHLTVSLASIIGVADPDPGSGSDPDSIGSVDLVPDWESGSGYKQVKRKKRALDNYPVSWTSLLDVWEKNISLLINILSTAIFLSLMS